MQLQREALWASLEEPKPTAQEIAAARGKVRNHLEDVTVEWLDEVTAIYPEACLDVRAMQRRHDRVLATCQFGVLMPYPARSYFSRLRKVPSEMPVDEIQEMLRAYDPQRELVLMMVREGTRGAEYGAFQLPRLKLR